MKYKFGNLAMLAFLASCAGDEADLRSHHYSSDASAVAEYSESIHWETAPTPTKTKPLADKPKEPTLDEETKEDDGPPADAAIRDLTPSIGVRNLDQIRYSMANITGVSAQHPNIRTAYTELRAQLPDNNDIRSLTPAKLSAITKLGAQFCDEAMLDQTTRAMLLPGIDFAAPPSTALASPNDAAEMLIERFWGTNLSTRADPAEDVDTLATLITELAAEQPNTAQATASIMMGACTAVISSAPVIVF